MWKRRRDMRPENKEAEKRVEYNENSIRDLISELVIGVEELREIHGAQGRKPSHGS